MANEIIRQLAVDLTKGCDALKSRIALFERVREIPYIYPASRDPLEVLQRSQGSCSGKHYLLAEMFRAIGCKVRHMICTHQFNESPIAFPEHMQALLRKSEIVDLHDCLQLAIDGNWVEIDATWQSALREYGFPVNDEWDGRSSQILSVTAEEVRIVETDPAKVKEEMLCHLSPRQRSLRKQFLEALSAWIQEIAAETRRDPESL